MTDLPAPPPRFSHRSLPEYAAILLVLTLVVSSIAATAPALDKLSRSVARLFAPSGMLMQMFPPDFSRIQAIGWKLLETLQMAVAGFFLGLLLAIPFAIPATDRLSPHPVVRAIARAVIALFRTAPDPVWAINRIQLRWETFCSEAEPLIAHVLAGPDRPALAFNDHTAMALLHPQIALHDRPFDHVADYPVTDLAADAFWARWLSVQNGPIRRRSTSSL